MTAIIAGVVGFVIGWLVRGHDDAKIMVKMMEGHTQQLEFMQGLLNDERYRNKD